MKRLLLAVLLLPSLALADADRHFVQMRDRAEPLGSLAVFLDKYVGECGGLFAGLGCRSAAEAFRKQYEGKALYMIVGEASAKMVRPGPYQPGSGDYTIDVTPVFPGDPYVLTQGTPAQLSTEGQPLLVPLRIRGTTPEGWSGTDFMRLFATHQVRLQVVFSPLNVWALERKQGGGRLSGVAARLDAVMLTNGRTGETLGMWFATEPPPTPAPAPTTGTGTATDKGRGKKKAPTR